MRILSTILASALILVPRIACAVELGDPQQGLAYARQVCAECHAVEAGDDLSPNPDAPSFEGVANTPGMNARALVVWLQSPHPTMPHLMIPPDETDNVVAYITSLRAKK
ncbi:MAG: c-type cytochrome [Hyphomicrobium sp.]